MLIRPLVVAVLALVLCSPHSSVSPTAVQTLRISAAGAKASSSVTSPVSSAQSKNGTKLLGDRQTASDAKNDISSEPGVAVEFGNVRAQVEQTEDVTSALIVPTTRGFPTRTGHGGTRDLTDNVQSDNSDPSLPVNDGELLPASLSAEDVNRLRLTIGVPYSDVPRGRAGAWSRTQSLDPDTLEVRAADSRFLPLLLMGDDPVPGDLVEECTHSGEQSAAVVTFVDAFDADGCASCELDDDGQPVRDYAEDLSSQLLTAGLDPKTAAERLRELFQAGLLDKDTFSAEDRRRGSLRFTNQPNTNCTCSVGDQETMCSSGVEGRFCDQLPYTTVPSGILEVSHTNISVLSVGSLEFVANVSVLRLAWNEVARVEPGVFANMSLLMNLSLAHNRLQTLDSEALYGASEVREIVLAYNMFTELTLATRALSVKWTPKLVHLNIGGNNFSKVGPQDFAPMRGVPLEDLQLHENNIKHIEPTTFLELKHLRRLRLRNNELPIDDIVELVEELNNTSLELIDLSMIGEYTICQLKPVLNAIANSSIISLMINNYCFPSINGVYFPKFPRLKELSMRSCGIKYIYGSPFNDFPELESLDLRDNPLTYVPMAVILPKLVSLDLSRPALRRYSGDTKPSFTLSQYRFRDMHNLKYLDLSYNNISKIERGAFVGLENLTVLLLKDTELEHIANFSFSMLENLSELHLSDNYLSAQPFEHLWQGLTGLTVLFLDHCRINDSNLYLSEMPRTELLNLTGNSLRNLTSGTFHGLSSLNTIDLSDNSIESWSEHVFSDCRALERIYLRFNSITWISSAMAEDFKELKLRVLMLGYNPFHCSCHLLDWLDGQDPTQEAATMMADWILFPERSSSGYITNDIDDCYCDTPEVFSNESVLEFFLHSDLSPCAEPSRPADRTRMLLTMLPVFVSGMVAAVVIRLVYKNRWYLRYWLFRLTSKQWLKRLRKDNEGFLYDAFVSYSSEDAGFVSEMVEQLEKTPPIYRLCVYERDFEIGNVISECILESINTSRKSILILTDHFAKSHWCRWEMSLVQCRLFEQTRDDLILVKLGKIRSRHLTPTIRHLMRTRIYIEWGPSAQQQLLFWERLRSALRRPGGTPELPRTV